MAFLAFSKVVMTDSENPRLLRPGLSCCPLPVCGPHRLLDSESLSMWLSVFLTSRLHGPWCSLGGWCRPQLCTLHPDVFLFPFVILFSYPCLVCSFSLFSVSHFFSLPSFFFFYLLFCIALCSRILMGSLASTDDHVPWIVKNWSAPPQSERLASVTITF